MACRSGNIASNVLGLITRKQREPIANFPSRGLAQRTERSQRGTKCDLLGDFSVMSSAVEKSLIAS